MIWHFARKFHFDYGTHVFHRYKDSAVCPITVFSTNDGRKLYSCKDLKAILYTPLSIEVLRGEQLIHERTILPDQIGKSHNSIQMVMNNLHKIFGTNDEFRSKNLWLSFQKY